MRNKSIFIIVVLLNLFNRTVFGLDTKIVAGSYGLQGVEEMAGNLSLLENQKYLASFSVGAADWVEEGTWKIIGEEVVLVDAKVKMTNAPTQELLLSAGTKLTYQQGKLSTVIPKYNQKIVFLDPGKTPQLQKTETACLPFKGEDLHVNSESFLLTVEKNTVIIESHADIISGFNVSRFYKDITVKRSWAEKMIPEIINPPQLYSSIGDVTIPASVIICAQDILSGEGRIRVRGLVKRIIKEDFGNKEEIVTIQMGMCHDFLTRALPKSVLEKIKANIGKAIDVEIPYSASVSQGSCF